MNRGKQQMTKERMKAMKKEVRLAQNPNLETKEKPLKSDTASIDLMLKKYPKKIATKSKDVETLFIKRVKTQKNKLKHPFHHSKRTNAGEVESGSPPSMPHREGERWVKSIQKQSKENNLRLMKNLSKQGRKR